MLPGTKIVLRTKAVSELRRGVISERSHCPKRGICDDKDVGYRGHGEIR
jgi:hypothetical protein